MINSIGDIGIDLILFSFRAQRYIKTRKNSFISLISVAFVFTKNVTRPGVWYVLNIQDASFKMEPNTPTCFSLSFLPPPTFFRFVHLFRFNCHSLWPFFNKAALLYNGITFARFQRKNYFTLAFFPFFSPLLNVLLGDELMSPARCLFPNNAKTLLATAGTALNSVTGKWFSERIGIHYYSVKYEYAKRLST